MLKRSAGLRRGMREGIAQGMTREQVVSLLGEPLRKLTGDELLGGYESVSGSATAIASISAQEFWAYRSFGSALQVMVTFVDGRVVDVTSGRVSGWRRMSR